MGYNPWKNWEVIMFGGGAWMGGNKRQPTERERQQQAAMLRMADAMRRQNMLGQLNPGYNNPFARAGINYAMGGGFASGINNAMNQMLAVNLANQQASLANKGLERDVIVGAVAPAAIAGMRAGVDHARNAAMAQSGAADITRANALANLASSFGTSAARPTTYTQGIGGRIENKNRRRKLRELLS